MPRKTKTNQPIKPQTPSVRRKKKKSKNYLNNEDLMKQVLLSKRAGSMNDELAKMLQTLTANFGKRDIFAGYTYNEDMQAYAMMMLVRTWHKFDETKYNNPFAFYTQCVKSSFIQYLNQEKRQRVIRDEILVKKGLTPSFTYQLEYEKSRHVEDEEDHYETVQAAKQVIKEQEGSVEDEFLSY